MLARNLKSAIERKFDGKVNQSELARQSGVSQKTISNILSALHLAPGEAPPSPSLSTLEALAEKLDVGVWELVHPDPDKIKRELEFYKRLEESYKKLQPPQPEPKRSTTERKIAFEIGTPRGSAESKTGKQTKR